MGKVAVVTGGSSGIGLQAARALRDAGCTVYELSRRASAEQGITHLFADVTEEATVNRAVADVAEREGRIDILIANAGSGISGAVEFTPLAEAERQVDINFFGTVRAVKAVLPVMRAQGGGRIVCTSSVAAPVPIPFQTYYSVSKAAINSFVQALQGEVAPFGITVCAVMPGDIRTGFTDARKKDPAGDDVYEGRISRSVERMEKDERGGMPAETAGRFLAKVALKTRVKPLYAIGFAYRAAWLGARLLPVRLKTRIIGKLYAS